MSCCQRLKCDILGMVIWRTGAGFIETLGLGLSVEIRQAGRDDLYNTAVFLDDCWREVYRDIVSDVFLGAMSPEERHKGLIKRYDDGSSDFWMMLDNERLIGAAVFGKSFTEGYENDGEISAIYLHKDYIGKGHGHNAFVRIEQALRDKGYANLVLDVLSANSRAIDFYLKHGYKKVADRTIKLGESEYPLTILRKKVRHNSIFQADGVFDRVQSFLAGVAAE